MQDALVPKGKENECKIKSKGLDSPIPAPAQVWVKQLGANPSQSDHQNQPRSSLAAQDRAQQGSVLSLRNGQQHLALFSRNCSNSQQESQEFLQECPQPGTGLWQQGPPGWGFPSLPAQD